MKRQAIARDSMVLTYLSNQKRVVMCADWSVATETMPSGSVTLYSEDDEVRLPLTDAQMRSAVSFYRYGPSNDVAEAADFVARFYLNSFRKLAEH